MGKGEIVKEKERVTPGLKEYIEAGYPCLFLQTVEPEVAMRRIITALGEAGDIRGTPIANIQFGVWKVTTGLMTARFGALSLESSKLTSAPKGQQMIDALSYVMDSKEPVMLVFHNIWKMLENMGNVQQLIDTIMYARTKGSCIFLVGAFLNVPPELRSLINFVDCPLPTVPQIKEQYTKFIKAYEDEMDLPEKEEELDSLLEHAATAAVGLDSMGAENAMALSMATSGNIDLKVIQSQKEQEIKKSDVLEFVRVEETIDDVGGFSELKEWLQKRREVFTDSAREYGLPFPKGVLIVGAGGTGKSLVAKAIASYLGLLCLRLDMGKVARSLYGESEAAMRLALQIVEAVAPVMLWIDEIDKGFSGIGGGGNLDGGVTQRTLQTFLTWRQETKAAVFIAATANEVSNLPSMVYRKGRFDEVWATDLPDINERKEIFSIHIKKLATKANGLDAKKYDMSSLAERTADFTGAEIEECVKDAMFSAFSKHKPVDASFIERAIADTIPQAKRDMEEVSSIRKWVAIRARQVSGKVLEEKQGLYIPVERSVKVKKKQRSDYN